MRREEAGGREAVDGAKCEGESGHAGMRHGIHPSPSSRFFASRPMTNRRVVKHRKVMGHVLEVETPTRWWGRFTVNGEDYEAVFSEQLPSHGQPGTIFTIHYPRRGKPYIYWPETYWTKRQLKKVRQKAREWAGLFEEDAA